MTASKRTAPRSIPVALTGFGVPAGRLLELQSETILPDPYVVTDTITITPPTKARADKIRESQMAAMMYNTMLNSAIGDPTTTQDYLDGLVKKVAESDAQYYEALFGDQCENITAFLADQDAQLVQAFQKDIVAQFFPSQPQSGKCGSCGQVIDTEAEGKASASSP